ncbi:PREDICTED: uncharacterized protein LOC106893491 [Calidris pugnax]|uniref:uncharacterized protein LOC106893491 n=1 Tax=Calidris pugnax TaxID=198806 RepID=UPI00071CBB9A|nr:PREDICTED: uncharacterized protein LOC106893491 [Calidris pugnax]
MEPEQAGRPLGLSPDGGRAGHEPPRPRGTGQGELGEGRRGEGRSGAGLAAPGSERDLQLPEGEQDARSAPQLAQGLLDQLDAHVAGTVRALQDDMRRVQERLSQLETLAAAQVRAGPGATRCRCRLARPLCPCWCRPGQQGSAWGGPGEGTPQGLGTHPGTREQAADPSQDQPASSPAPQRPEDTLPEEQHNGPHVPDAAVLPARRPLPFCLR